MTESLKKKRRATYEDLLQLPEGIIGEILDGELYTSPRPSPRHALAEGGLTEELRGPFQTGKGGPGGWWILAEPELHLGPKSKQDILVPDLAGWRKERLPKIPDEAYLSLVPDWVGEILSPSNARLDRVQKVPKYATFGVKYLWLINPWERTLEAFRLEKKGWLLLGTFSDDDKIRVAPFQSNEIDLKVVWGEELPQNG